MGGFDVTPDLAGFVAAQRNLIADFGRDVRFYGPATILYDPTLPVGMFDDEGLPLDPTVTGSAQASANVPIPDLTYVGSAKCDVVFQPLTAIRRDEVLEDELAIRSRLNKDLILNLEDVPTVKAATYFQVGTNGADGTWVADEEELWKIVNAKPYSMGVLYRYIVFGQGTL